MSEFERGQEVWFAGKGHSYVSQDPSDAAFYILKPWDSDEFVKAHNLAVKAYISPAGNFSFNEKLRNDGDWL